MGFGRYRFRRSFGQVKSQFRGARPDTYPLTQPLLSLYPATAAYSAYDLGNNRGNVTESEGGTRYVVSGAGTAAVNGEYVENGLSSNGNKVYTLYRNGAVALNLWSYSNTRWLITSSAVDSLPVFGDIYYEELTASTTPPALLSAAYSGELPTPTVAALTTRTVLNPVQRWRRSSDDALQMFTAKDIANGTALTWGGTTAYLLTEYDQSGNDYDLTQTTAANQPLVVSGGALTRDSRGNVAPDFDGTNDSLNSSLVPPSSATLIGVAEWDVVGSTLVVIGARDTTTQRSYIGATSNSVIAVGAGNGTVGTATPIAGETYLVTGSYTGIDLNCAVDGVNVTGSVTSNVANTTQGYSLGALNSAGTDTLFMDGHIAAVLVYNTDQSANRADIEAKLSTIVTTAIS